jgi:hypothetical protein
MNFQLHQNSSLCFNSCQVATSLQPPVSSEKMGLCVVLSLDPFPSQYVWIIPPSTGRK